MAKEDLAKFEGIITSTPGGGHYLVQLENKKIITAKLSGKMKQNKIRCIVGDQVTVGISVYDLEHGIILFRKNKRGPIHPNQSGLAKTTPGAATTTPGANTDKK